MGNRNYLRIVLQIYSSSVETNMASQKLSILWFRHGLRYENATYIGIWKCLLQNVKTTVSILGCTTILLYTKLLKEQKLNSYRFLSLMGNLLVHLSKCLSIIYLPEKIGSSHKTDFTVFSFYWDWWSMGVPNF